MSSSQTPVTDDRPQSQIDTEENRLVKPDTKYLQPWQLNCLLGGIIVLVFVIGLAINTLN